MKQSLSILAAAVLVAALWGCGGGGGGSVPPQTVPPTGDSARPGGIAAAAANRPATGESVVQSSTGDSDLSVSVAHAPGGSVRFTIARGTKWSLGSDDERTHTITNNRGRRPASGLTLTGVVAFEGRSEAEAGVAEGVLVVFLTDIEGAGDSDFLVWGSWGNAPTGSAIHEDTIEGAFAAGSDPFRPERLASLRGTATYTGDADGRYIEPGLRDSVSFDARVTLEADFGDAEASGAITGRVEGLRFYRPDTREFLPGPAAAVTLGNAAISAGGFFSAQTAGTHRDGAALSGRWGGRFFGNGASDSPPDAVAGTFGAASPDGARALIGAFGARRR